MTVPRVLVEGLGDITNVVVFDDCDLNISAQGESSASTLVVKDVGEDPIEFITGKRVTIDIDGDVIWAGFLIRAARNFWFDVDTQTTSQRRWNLTLVDVSILFNKRVVFKQSAPKKFEGPAYRDPTYDDDIIDDLVSDWLDLSTDDIDTSTLVERVAIVNPSSVGCNPPDQTFYPFNGSMLWGEAMEIISQMPAAIWGMLPGEPLGDSPFARLFYADVDDEDAPFTLTDNPTTSNHAGYREMTIWEDGSELINDEYAWGAGKGENHMVFEREQASGSITNHGRWQDGNLLYGIWCNDTIEKVADAIVNGSPGSRRGHKNPIDVVDVVTHVDGFRVGQKVRFISDEYSYDQVLPIRRMNMTFPTHDRVRYKMRLSESFDAWGFQDPLPPFRSFHFRGFKPEFPPPPPFGCIWFDRFERSVSAGWDSNDFGFAYSYASITNPSPGSGNGTSVADFGEGSVGKLRWEFGSPLIYFGPNGASNSTDVGPWQEDVWTFRMRFKTGNWTMGVDDGYAIIRLGTNARSVYFGTGANPGGSYEFGFIETDDSARYDFEWHPQQWYEVKWRYDFLTGDSWLKVWHEDGTEPDWLITDSSYGGAGGDDPSIWMRVGGETLSGGIWDSTNPYVAYFDDFDFDYAGKSFCTLPNFLDTFDDRIISDTTPIYTVAGGDSGGDWGTASCGVAYDPPDPFVNGNTWIGVGSSVAGGLLIGKVTREQRGVGASMVGGRFANELYPLPAPTDDEPILSCRFRAPSTIPDGSSGGGGTMGPSKFTMLWFSDDASESLEVACWISSDTGYGGIAVFPSNTDTVGGAATFAKTGWIGGRLYALEAQFLHDGTIRARVYLDGDPPPAWSDQIEYAYGSDYGAWTGSGGFDFEWRSYDDKDQGGGTLLSQRMEFDNFAMGKLES